MPAPAHVFGISFVARLYRTHLRVAGAGDVAVRLHAESLPRAVGGRAAGAPVPAQAARASARQLALALGDEARRRPRRPMPTRILCWRCGAGPGATAFASTTSCPTATSTSASRIRPPARRRPRCWPRCSGRSSSARRAAATPRRATSSLVMFGAPDPRRELETVAAEILVAGAARRHAALRRLRGRGSRRVGGDLPAAGARGVRRRRPSCPTPCWTCRRPPRATSWRRSSCCSRCRPGRWAAPSCSSSRCTRRSPRRFPDVDPEDFLALCEQLGIVRGADGARPRRQLRRRGSGELGPGAAAAGAGRVPFGAAQRRGAAVRRSTASDAGRRAARGRGARGPRAGHHRARADRLRAHGARRCPRRVAEFMALLRRTLAATIRPAGPEEQAALGDCFAAAGTDRGGGARRSRGRLRRRRRAGARASGGGAARGRGRPRASPSPRSRRCARCRSGSCSCSASTSGCFPSADGVRRARPARGGAAPQPGDVTPREQDEYVFLETLLSARERLYLSYIARDAETGERKDPSSTVAGAAATCSDGARAAMSCSSGITRPDPPLRAPPRRRRLRGDARRPRASARRSRSGSRCGRRRP